MFVCVRERERRESKKEKYRHGQRERKRERGEERAWRYDDVCMLELVLMCEACANVNVCSRRCVCQRDLLRAGMVCVCIKPLHTQVYIG